MIKLRVVILVLVVFLTPTVTIASSSLNGIEYSMAVESPIQGATYSSDTITMKVKTAPYRMEFWNSVFDIDCYLDGKFYSKIALVEAIFTEHEYLISSGEITLQGLSQGEHTITASGKGSYDSHSQEHPEYPGSSGAGVLSPISLSFLVNLGIAPSVSVLRLSMYQTSQVELNVTTDRAVAAVFYSLDGQENVTLPQNQAVHVADGYQYNVTLTEVADGAHVVEAYAVDGFGNTGATTANFNVKNTAPQPTQQPTDKPAVPIWLVAIVMGTIVAVTVSSAVILVLYRKIQNTK